MKFSIGARLFIAVLLSILGVAAIALALMSGKVSESFSDYAIQIELDRLQEVSDALQAHYAENNDWSFLPEDEQEKKEWVSRELLRLHEKKNSTSNVFVAPPAEPVAPAEPAKPAEPVRARSQNITNLPPTSDSMLPPLPPVPPAPPVPPVPPEPPFFPPNSVAMKSKKTANNVEYSGTLRLPSLYQRITILDQQHRYLAGRFLDNTSNASRSIFYRNKVIGYLQVTKSDQPTDALAKVFLQKQADIIMIIIALSVALSALAASLLAMHFRRPILRLVEGSSLLADGHFGTRLTASRSDELGELARSFNQLADKLERAEESRRQWVADTSHELRTPISVLRAQLEAMQDGIRQATPANIALMLRQILSLNKLIDELYALARADVGELQYQMQSLNLWELAVEQAGSFQEKMDAKQLHLLYGAVPARADVMGDPDRLRQVLSNLYENCLRYTNPGGCVTLHTETQGTTLLLIIDDSAPGVPDAALLRLGERFYRVDSSRNREQGGSGLGLALCSRIIENHQGIMHFSHAPTGGLRVQIQIPLQPPSPEPSLDQP